MNTSLIAKSLSSRTGALLLAAGALWACAVALLAAKGFFSNLVGAPFAMVVAAGIAVPALAYFVIPPVRSFIESVGLYPLTILHTWRIPAALLFFWYGFQGQLPPWFWIPAGIGDFLVGLYATRLFFRRGDTAFYWRFHVLGFADFVIAVGSGLTHTLLMDPRMAPIALLPLALIPLFGVGISGASHLVAFDLLRRANRPRSRWSKHS
jgi:hypothetical protein